MHKSDILALATGNGARTRTLLWVACFTSKIPLPYCQIAKEKQVRFDSLTRTARNL
jgi:hypothetical protein